MTGKIFQGTVLTVLLIMFSSQSMGLVSFEDGQIHDVNSLIDDIVYIVNNPSGTGTTVNWLNGADTGTGNYIRIYGDSILNIAGGTAGGDVFCVQNSQLNMSGGLVTNNVEGSGSSTITISGGTITDNLIGSEDTQISISGGTIEGEIIGLGNCQVYITGGNFGSLSAGVFGSDNSVFIIEGHDFAIDSNSVDFGQYYASDFPSGTITGILKEDNEIICDFEISGSSSIILSPDANIFSLLTPNGDERLMAGHTFDITWQSLSLMGQVSLEYSNTNSLDWYVIDVNIPDTGIYIWTVPQISSNQCLVRISDSENAGIYDISNDNFTIFVCRLTSVMDLNNDCVIDLVDFAVFSQEWFRNGNPFDSGFTEGPADFVIIPGGEFLMGNHHFDPNEAYDRELPVHAVYIDPFYMGKYEVTNSQYCEFLNDGYSSGLITVSNQIIYDSLGNFIYSDTYDSHDRSRIFYDGDTFTVLENREDHPVSRISWYGTVAYCNWLSIRDGYEPCYDLETWDCDFLQTGYYLPTEAQWEYAARGGMHDPYYKFPWGNIEDTSKVNWLNSGDPYESGSTPRSTPVGYYEPNGYGLYDMAGNMWEWCNDFYAEHYYDVSPYRNPTGPVTGQNHSIRGGSWSYVRNIHTAYRLHGPAESRFDCGFRIVRNMD